MEKNIIDSDTSVISRCTQKHFDKILSEYGIGYTHLSFLTTIYENEGMQMISLANSNEYDKGTISKSIKALEENGFVEIVNSEEDKRSKKIFTTNKARELMPKLYLLRQNWTNYLCSDLNEEEKEKFNVSLSKLLQRAKEYNSKLAMSEQIKIYGLQKLSLLDYPGKMACTIFTGGCNFRCPFCHNKSLVFLNPNEKEISSEEVLSYLEERKNVLDGICITGGEPLLHDSIKSFLQEVRKTKLSIKLDTNGSNLEKLKELIEEGLVDYVAMDIKNSKELYPKTVGLGEFDFKEVEETIKYLLENHIPYEFRTTLVKEFHEDTNFDDLGKMIKGCKHYYLQQFEDHGTCIEQNLSALPKEKVIKIKEVMSKYCEDVQIRGIEEG